MLTSFLSCFGFVIVVGGICLLIENSVNNMKKIIISLIAMALVGCGEIPPNQEAYDTAYANKCMAGKGSPIEAWEFYKQNDDWTAAYYMYKDQIVCGERINVQK